MGMILSVMSYPAEAQIDQASGCVIELFQHFSGNGTHKQGGFRLSRNKRLRFWFGKPRLNVIRTGRHAKGALEIPYAEFDSRWGLLISNLQFASMSGARVVVNYTGAPGDGWGVYVFPDDPCE